jgi:mannitol/fructose-specific phosphotransferase system IIA component (Ntr-type)
MNLDDLPGPNRPPIHDLKATTRWEAIDELIGLLVAQQRIASEHKEAIATAVKKREYSMSTGVGKGIALPHASTDLVSNAFGTLGRSRTGIQFDAPDGKPVNLVFLFLVPAADFQKHANALANIAKLLRRKDFWDGLM